jgi:hypothetical protein
MGLGWRLLCGARQSENRRRFIAANHPKTEQEKAQIA